LSLKTDLSGQGQGPCSEKEKSRSCAERLFFIHHPGISPRVVAFVAVLSARSSFMVQQRSICGVCHWPFPGSGATVAQYSRRRHFFPVRSGSFPKKYNFCMKWTEKHMGALKNQQEVDFSRLPY